MSQDLDLKVYIDHVKLAANWDNTLEARTPHTASPIASWLNGTTQETKDIAKVFDLARNDGADSRQAICIVEDVSWEWIGRMGATWGIESHFFAGYCVNPKDDNPWRTLFPDDRRLGATQGPSKYYHVDGVFEHHHLAGDSTGLLRLKQGLRRSLYPRRCWADPSYPPSSNTRFSYCRVNANLCMATHLLLWPLAYPCLDLFLVDPPPFLTAHDVMNPEKTNITASMQQYRAKTSLRVQCPVSCGVVLPQLLKQRGYSLRRVLGSVFRHDSHSNISFLYADLQMAINRGELLHLVAASLHRTNFISIEHEIKAVSFLELPDPNMRTNAKLLTLREVLSELSTGAAETSKYTPSHVKRFYEEVDREPHARDKFDFHSPIVRLAALNKQASALERFLMDSFQLLMSSISVAETQNAAKQAKMSADQATRSARLTKLAFVYIPLTFVTSIFGMNVRELSDPVPSIWVCIVTLLVVAVATAAIFGSYKYKAHNPPSMLLKEQEADTWSLRRIAVLPPAPDAVITDVEKGPVAVVTPRDGQL